jgi:hypothetical protein
MIHLIENFCPEVSVKKEGDAGLCEHLKELDGFRETV